MNLSIITTALPSLGRLVVELQPDVYAFTYHGDDIERVSGPKGDRYKTSTLRKSHLGFGEPPLSPGSSVQVTTRTGWPLRDDSESLEGLVEETNVIQQTIHFSVH